MKYTIHRAAIVPPLDGNWNSPHWQKAETLEVARFYDRSSDHRPKTEARVLYDSKGVYVFFRVQDRYVRAVAAQYQDSVCTDSCVEFFVQPKTGKGYFNFEVNCGGVVLLYFVEDAAGGAGDRKNRTHVPKELFETMRVYHSMPARVPEEIAEPTVWTVAYFVPFSLFEAYVGPVGDVAGQTWRANFYKCADKTSHPHWASWVDIGPILSFHQPAFFAPIEFARD